MAALLLVAALAATAAAAPPPPLSAEWLVEQIRVLSAPEMDGRASGTPGATRAADHIVRVLAQAGLRPGGDGGTFLQPFTVPTGLALGPRNTLDVPGAGAAPLALGRDFTPLAISADGVASGDVVFVGYGITATALGWDDYAGIDVRGKLVLATTSDPGGTDATSPFRRPEAYHFRERAHKVINARQHGAAGILLVTHPSESSETLPTLSGISQPLGIVATFVTRRVADLALGPASTTLRDLAAAVERARQPQSRALSGVRAQVEVNLVRQRGTTTNVIGILPGTDPRLEDEAIVIGAHYDHLGHGGEGSLAPEQVGAIHHGADDNGSGTAAVLGLARAFAAAGGVPRTLVFIAFSGEELGLLGSAHYVRHPAFPLDKTVLMLNLDMVGRLRDDKLYVGGVDSGSTLRAVAARAARGLPLAPELRGEPFAPSDHTSFYTAGRPVLFLFTGAHADYHRPSDTWDRINGPGLVTVADFAARVVSEVAQDPRAPVYVKFEAPAASTRGGYGPYFGVVPEFGDAERPGVRVGGVRSGSPADKAGVQSGDVLVRFAGIDVKTLQDFTFALRGKRPGDRVEVVILRGGREQRLEALLAERRQ